MPQHRQFLSARVRAFLVIGLVGIPLALIFQHLIQMDVRFSARSPATARALAHYLAGDYSGAARFYSIDLARRAATVPPDQANSWVVFIGGDLEGAALRAQSEAKAAPGDPEPLLTLAEIALARRDLPEALDFAGRVLAAQRDDYDALLVTAVARARQGRPDAAIDALKRALRYDRVERRLSVFLAVLEVTGEHRARAMQPTYWWPHYALGWVYAAGGEYGRAVESFEKVTALRPGLYDVQRELDRLRPLVAQAPAR